MLRVYKNISVAVLMGVIWLQFLPSASASEHLSPWTIYYGNKLPASYFESYELVILDSANHAMVPPLIEKGKTVLGYLSLGEIAQNRPWFSEVKSERLLLTENKNWPGSFFVDVRDTRWVSRVVEELIPEMLHRGFNGVFLDALDIPAALESQDSKRYQGMNDAAVQLVLTIRRHYPDIKIMMNRGYDLLPHVGQAIDMELGESLFSAYNFKTESYDLVDTKLHQSRVDLLKSAARKFPELSIYTLDYWGQDDAEGISKIYTEMQNNGFIPLVSTIGLSQSVPNQ